MDPAHTGRAKLLLLTALGLGCGSVTGLPDSGPRDDGGTQGDGAPQADGADAREAGGGQDAAGDGATSDRASAACDPTRPFGAPAPLAAFNTTSSDDAVSLSRDRLTAYLSSNRPGGMGGYDIWTATRAALTQDFGVARPVAGVNTAEDERSPVTTGDGLLLFFTSTFQASGAHDIRLSSRTNTLVPFDSSVPLPGINTASDEASVSLSDDLLIYFFSDRPGGAGMYDVYVGNLGSAGVTNVRAAPELSSASNDTAPVVTPDGLTIFFSSSRAAAGTRGDNDIWTARRPSAGVAFGAPQIVAELNSAASDAITWVSADGCTVYLQSDREAGIGGRAGYDLYEATRGR